MKASKLQVFGLGVVAANKALDSKDIEVTPTEVLPMLDGEISDNLQTVTASGQDASGSKYTASVDTTATVKATWMPFGSNRVTPPDVRRGETVVLYRFADNDKYYWASLFYDMQLRKLETVIYAFSNTQQEQLDGAADTTYYLEVSTHTKLMSLHTSKSDGEPFGYDFQINAKEGYFTFRDDVGNIINVDSKNTRMELINADGSHIDMDRQVITMTAPDTVNIIGGNKVYIKAPSIMTESDTTHNETPDTTTTGNVNVLQNMVVSLTTTTSGMRSVNQAGGSGRGPIEGSVLNIDQVQASGGGTFGGEVDVLKLTSSQAISAPNV